MNIRKCGGNSQQRRKFARAQKRKLAAMAASVAAMATTATPAPVDHLVVLPLENHSYSQVVGSSQMPYLNSLIADGGLATNYDAVTHPSIGNYFSMTTGQIITNDDSYTKTVTVDNIVRELLAAGRTWKRYSEGATRHDPLSFFSDVRNDANQKKNLVPFSQLAQDIDAGNLADYSFVVLSDQHNAHSASLKACDDYLSAHIDPLLQSPAFGNGLLIIVFDESLDSDTAHGGGHVAWVAAGPAAKQGYSSNTFYQHPSTLRLSCDVLGIATPAAAAGAPGMSEFVNSSSPTPTPTPTPSPSPTPPPGGSRLAISDDGNYHDRDDICSAPVNIAELAKSGNASRLVYYGYADHYWLTNSSQEQDMSDSVTQALARFPGFGAAKVFNVRVNHLAAVQALTSEINASSASNPLTILGQGPMQVIGEAIAASNQSNRKYVTVESHSTWNDQHAKKAGASEGLSMPRYGWNDFAGMGVNPVHIKDQNKGLNKDYSQYTWLRDSSDPDLQFLWQRGQVAGKSTFDCSDAGLTYFAITGDDSATPAKLEALLAP